eukprot:gene7977-13881_t
MASTAAKAAIPEDSKVISLTEKEQLPAMLNKAARMLGFDRDDWETLQKIHFEKLQDFIKKRKSKASLYIIAEAAHDGAMSDDKEDYSCNSHPSFITDTAMSLEKLPETSMMNKAGIEHKEALAFVKDLQQKHNMQVDSHSDSQNESDSHASIISGDNRAHEDFFPAAFSTQPTVIGPLEFDFKKHVYDTLRLQCRLQENNKRPTAAHPKAHTFKSCEQLNACIGCWKQDYSCFLNATRDTADEQSVDEERKSLNKWEIFLKSGKPTEKMCKPLAFKQRRWK